MVKEGMSNDELINMLRLGEQTPVMVIFNNIRTKETACPKGECADRSGFYLFDQYVE